jgi:hypothetical protein
MELLPVEINDEIYKQCDIYTSFQLACTCQQQMMLFKYKLQRLAKRGFGDLGKAIAGVKLPHGFAGLIYDNYLASITTYDSRLSSQVNADIMRGYRERFAAINNLFGTVRLPQYEINVDVLLNAKLSINYAYINRTAITRILFNLFNNGNTATVAAIIYLQRWNSEYLRKVVYGICLGKSLWWRHRDVVDSSSDDGHSCEMCRYGNFNYYDPVKADEIAKLGKYATYYPTHIAYAYKYLNYWP